MALPLDANETVQFASLVEPSLRKPAVSIGLEFSIRAVPAILFFICAYMRFKKIKPIGFTKTLVFSKMFRTKWVLQYF